MSQEKTKDSPRRKMPSPSYMKLITRYRLCPLRSDKEHDRALGTLRTIGREMHGKRRDAGTRDYLYVLVHLILKYEREAGHEINGTRVGAADLIRFLLEQRSTSANSLAERLEIPRAALYAILNGRRDWSASAIAKLSRHFELSRDFFLRSSGRIISV